MVKVNNRAQGGRSLKQTAHLTESQYPKHVCGSEHSQTKLQITIQIDVSEKEEKTKTKLE